MPYSCDHFVHAILLTLLLTPAYIYFSAFSFPESVETTWNTKTITIKHRSRYPCFESARKKIAHEYSHTLTGVSTLEMRVYSTYTLISIVLTPVRVGLGRESD
jgi:hypothetical protein